MNAKYTVFSSEAAEQENMKIIFHVKVVINKEHSQGLCDMLATSSDIFVRSHP